MDQTTGTPDGQPDDDALLAARAEQQAPADRGARLEEQAVVMIGIATGVLGVLLAIGFVFLPASTLPEKMYVLFACLALSAASVIGIGAWRSPRRFGLTAASVGVAIVCLAMNNIIASHQAKLLQRSTFTLAGELVIKQSSSDLSNGEPNFSKTAQGCQGTRGYSDLSAGTAVLVTDSLGHQIAVGAMQTGKLADRHRNWCVMTFSVSHVPRGLPSYSLTISHRGTQVYTPQTAQAGVELEIGS